MAWHRHTLHRTREEAEKAAIYWAQTYTDDNVRIEHIGVRVYALEINFPDEQEEGGNDPA